MPQALIENDSQAQIILDWVNDTLAQAEKAGMPVGKFLLAAFPSFFEAVKTPNRAQPVKLMIKKRRYHDCPLCGNKVEKIGHRCELKMAKLEGNEAKQLAIHAYIRNCGVEAAKIQYSKKA